MGDSITDGTLAEIESVGESVESDQVVARIETDKVVVDVRAPSSGKVLELKAKVGDTVKVGAPLFVLQTGEGGKSTENKKQSTPSAASSQPIPPAASSSSSAASSSSPHVRHPLIHFRYGKRDVSPAPTHSLHQSPSSGTAASKSSSPTASAGSKTAPLHPDAFFAPIDGKKDWIEANEKAFKAYTELPEYYKRRAPKPVELQLIELGGAAPYEVKSKKGAAKE